MHAMLNAWICIKLVVWCMLALFRASVLMHILGLHTILEQVHITLALVRELGHIIVGPLGDGLGASPALLLFASCPTLDGVNTATSSMNPRWIGGGSQCHGQS